MPNPMTAYCANCGQSRPVSCTEEQYRRWQSGAKIQDAMPDLPAAERDLLLSGICETCWREIFHEEWRDRK